MGRNRIDRGENMSQGLKLGVNIDHVATLRQVRGTVYPDVIEAAGICEEAGARGITVHLREDRRHIQDKDVFELRERIKTGLNLEMANSAEILAIALRAKPDEVCMVPERRRELTTEGGLDVAGSSAEMRGTVEELSGADIAVSLFVAPDRVQLDACAKLGVPCVELHTGSFCESTGEKAERELSRLIEAAHHAHELGLIVNAGHGINMDNVHGILEIPHLHTLNIGHSIIARAVFSGLRESVREMIVEMSGYTGGRE